MSPGGLLPGSLVCSACGYGIALVVPPAACPMCREPGAKAWVDLPRPPFGRIADDAPDERRDVS